MFKLLSYLYRTCGVHVRCCVIFKWIGMLLANIYSLPSFTGKDLEKSNVWFSLQNSLDLKVVEVMIKCLQHSDYEVGFSIVIPRAKFRRVWDENPGQKKMRVDMKEFCVELFS